MIFISYAREDAASAMALAAELAEAGLPFLIDPPLAQGDAFWRDRLAEQMADCSLMVMLDTAAAGASPWVQQERRGFAGAGGALVIDAAHRGDAVARIRARWQRTAPAGGERPPARTSAGPEAEAGARQRREHLLRAQSALQARCAHEAHGRRVQRAEFDGARAWLAAGRVELRRVAVDGVTGLDGAALYLATSPLINTLYREFLQAFELPPPPTWDRAEFASPQQPVTGLTWHEAAACAAWFGAELPSEALWSAAARPAGGAAYATATGELDPTQAHYGRPFALGAPATADAHPPNATGFSGLCGNTWDWCADSWHAGSGPGALCHPVIRGGGWMDDAAFCRASARYRNASIDRDCCVGLRLALRGPHSAS